MTAVVAEWLRRLTRNQFLSEGVGSNPTNCGNFFCKFLYLFIYVITHPMMIQMEISYQEAQKWQYGHDKITIVVNLNDCVRRVLTS